MTGRSLLSAAILSVPFRAFFLGAAAHSVIAVVVWAAFLLHGALSAGLLPDPFLWHGHTMISGFAGAVIAGFLLTAAGNWTGRQTAPPLVLLSVVGLWLLGRLGDFLPGVPPLVAFIGDGGFWLLLVVLLLRVIILTRNWRNIGFGVLPLAFGAVDAGYHLEDTQLIAAIARPALWVGVDLLIVIMGAMGGRIIPFFTGRRLMSIRIRNPALLAIATNALLIAVVPANILYRGEPVAAWLMLFAGVLLLARLAGWNSGATRREPMLWVLHLGFAWLGLALVLRAVAICTGAFLEATALHAVTVGALGTLGLGMMTRVAMGHTGRAIIADRLVIIAFLLVSLAGAARLTSLLGAPAWFAYGVSSSLWAFAFALYLWRFVPILISPRKTA